MSHHQNQMQKEAPKSQPPVTPKSSPVPTPAVIVTKTLSPEEKQKRSAAAEANKKALEPYIDEAQNIVARKMGIANPEAMVSLMNIKQIAAKVYAEAKTLKDIAEGKPEKTRGVPGGTPKWIAKFQLQMQKAIGFAQKHKISAENIVKTIEFAVANPISAPSAPKAAS